MDYLKTSGGARQSSPNTSHGGQCSPALPFQLAMLVEHAQCNPEGLEIKIQELPGPAVNVPLDVVPKLDFCFYYTNV